MRKEPIDNDAALNFNYPPKEFVEDWAGVRRYANRKRATDKRVVQLSGKEGEASRRLPTDQNESADAMSQWFMDQYGDDPDHLYARFMRFTMLADVFETYEDEIRKNGLPLTDGYCEELLPYLLRLPVRADQRDFARLDPKDVRRVITTAGSRRPHHS